LKQNQIDERKKCVTKYKKKNPSKITAKKFLFFKKKLVLPFRDIFIRDESQKKKI